MIFAEEKIINFKTEVEYLLANHWEKAIKHKDYQLQPDWLSYYKLQEADAIKTYTARCNTALVGYASVYTIKSLYTVNRQEAHYDMIYVSPEFRKGRVGANLLKFVEKKLKDLGVKQITIGSLVHQPFDNLLESLNYSCIEKNYIKYIG